MGSSDSAKPDTQTLGLAAFTGSQVPMGPEDLLLIFGIYLVDVVRHLMSLDVTIPKQISITSDGLCTSPSHERSRMMTSRSN